MIPRALVHTAPVERQRRGSDDISGPSPLRQWRFYSCSQAQIDASEIIDKSGKRIIDPENNKKTPQQGAATTVWSATRPQLNGMGGVYCENCDIARALPSDDSQELHGVRPRDPVAAGRLWRLSEQLTGAGID